MALCRAYNGCKGGEGDGLGRTLQKSLPAKSLLPFPGYAVFGPGNVILLSMSMRTIPASTAFAVWMAVALISTKMIDTFWFRQPASGMQLLWFACIIIGVIGLKRDG